MLVRFAGRMSVKPLTTGSRTIQQGMDTLHPLPREARGSGVAEISGRYRLTKGTAPRRVSGVVNPIVDPGGGGTRNTAPIRTPAAVVTADGRGCVVLGVGMVFDRRGTTHRSKWVARIITT